jgi:uncharacterized membrane protein YgcG
MSRIERQREDRERQGGKPTLRMIGVLIVVITGLAVPACDWYEHPGTYYCDETNNCADVPTTICQASTNTCECPTVGHIWCFKYSKCIPEAECFQDAGAPCDAGSGSGGSGGGAGGAGGGGGGGGGGG